MEIRQSFLGDESCEGSFSVSKSGLKIEIKDKYTNVSLLKKLPKEEMIFFFEKCIECLKSK